MSKKKMTAEQKEAFKDRMAKARAGRTDKNSDTEIERIANSEGKNKKPATQKQRREPLDPDPEGKYPKVEIGTWPKNKKRLGDLVDRAFKEKHKARGTGVERGGKPSANAQQSAKPAPVTLS